MRISSSLQAAIVAASLVVVGAIGFTVTLVNAEQLAIITIAGCVDGGSGKHTIRVALWDAQGFLKEAVQETSITAGGDAKCSFMVRPGRWAISAYEDRNENGKLDTGFHGPREPYVATAVLRDVADANIRLR